MSRRRKKKREPIALPIASMGDIAFLLIIFFLVCSEAIKDNSNVPVTLPRSKHVATPKATVAAYVTIDGNGVIHFDGKPVDNPKDIEFLVTGALSSTVADDQRHIQFKCDKSQPKEIFQPVLQAIASAGGIIEAVGEPES
ncbi:MAG: Biopolymer transport protein ExbD/TolR [Verrucomicrobiota bacterium]|jgi:biopolymer transport protein ExbD